MKEKEMKYFEYCMFFYFLIGVIGHVLIKFTDIDFTALTILYVNTFTPVLFAYLIVSCILYKYSNYWMNIIDGILSFVLTMVYPYPIFIYIYNFNKYLYYFLGLCFAFIPLVFCAIDKKKIELFHLIKVLTRLLIIIFVVFIILMLNSCGARF